MLKSPVVELSERTELHDDSLTSFPYDESNTYDIWYVNGEQTVKVFLNIFLIFIDS